MKLVKDPVKHLVANEAFEAGDSPEYHLVWQYVYNKIYDPLARLFDDEIKIDIREGCGYYIGIVE